jgi:hypothetical protein
MKDDNTSKSPYLAYTTFKNFITSLNKNGIIPSRIDKTLMLGQSGSTQSYLLSTLRFFGLIDENNTPTDDLQQLVGSEGDERKKIWKQIFDRAYSPIIGELDLPRATLGMLHERFASQGLTGATVRKCHSFYAAAAEDAGIALPPQLKANARGSGSRKGRKKAAGSRSAVGEEPEDEFGDTEGNGGGGNEASQLATLLLDREGKRSVKVKAPAMITKAELERIQKWLSFQLIVEDDE